MSDTLSQETPPKQHLLADMIRALPEDQGKVGKRYLQKLLDTKGEAAVYDLVRRAEIVCNHHDRFHFKMLQKEHLNPDQQKLLEQMSMLPVLTRRAFNGQVAAVLGISSYLMVDATDNFPDDPFKTRKGPAPEKKPDPVRKYAELGTAIYLTGKLASNEIAGLTVARLEMVSHAIGELASRLKQHSTAPQR